MNPTNWWPPRLVPERQLAPRAWLALRDDGARVVVKAGAVHPLLAQVRHPHLARVVADGDGWHATAFVDGETLAACLARGAVAPVAALRWMDQVLAALDALHAHGLVHRDVQPANVVIDGRGDAVLIDFGLACAPGPCAVQGTPASTAPEQWRGQAGPPADLFSAGVLLYRLLAGCHPFPGPPFVAMQHILAGNYRLLPGPLSALAPVFAKALAADPARRFTNAVQFRQMLVR